jgi:hypothetical protein
MKHNHPDSSCMGTEEQEVKSPRKIDFVYLFYYEIKYKINVFCWEIQDQCDRDI